MIVALAFTAGSILTFLGVVGFGSYIARKNPHYKP